MSRMIRKGCGSKPPRPDSMQSVTLIASALCSLLAISGARPSILIMYETHQYFDAGHTVTYKFGSLLCCNRLAGDQDLALENSRSDVSVRGRSRPAAKLLPR